MSGRRFLSFTLYCVAWAFAAGSPVTPEEEALELRTRTLESMRRLLLEYSLPSLSMAISIEGEIVFAEAIGYANVKSQVMANVETRYSVGSIAKPMTGVALARLVDAKKIDLDADIHRYIEPYPNIGYGLTIRQLASHTGGVVHDSPERRKYGYSNVRDRLSPFDVLDVCSGHALLFEPGTNFNYSSSGYILLSAAIESASNRSYVEFMKESVWVPLGMLNTAHDTSQERGPMQAEYYSGVSSNGQFIPAQKKRDRSFLFGGGGFISTPSDLVKLSSAIFENGFISKQSREVMLTPVVLENGDVNEQAYGLGWRMKPMPDVAIEGRQLEVVHHGGVTSDAATAFLLLIPEYKAAIAFATNIVPERFWEMRSRSGAILVEFL